MIHLLRDNNKLHTLHVGRSTGANFLDTLTARPDRHGGETPGRPQLVPSSGKTA
jgi:hypothetical protein